MSLERDEEPKSEFRIQNSEVGKRRDEGSLNRVAPEDIYERSFRFGCRILRFYRAYERRSRVPRPLLNQLLNAGTAVGSNMHEAKSAESRADFIHKARVALKEARESHYWLRLFDASEVVPARSIQSLVNEANEIVAVLTSIVKRTSLNKKT